jgi:hypothetical protein
MHASPNPTHIHKTFPQFEGSKDASKVHLETYTLEDPSS